VQPSQGSRLDSWKAIADYLGRNVRTATRWADERGLPIHSVPGGKRRAIFAYKDEIDAWLNNRNASPSSSAVSNGKTDKSEREVKAPLGFERVFHQPKLRHVIRRVRVHNWSILLGGVCTLGLALILAGLSINSHISAALRPLRFAQITDDGCLKENLRIAGSALYFNEYEGNRRVLRTAPFDGGPIRQIATPFANVVVQDVSGDSQSVLVTSFQGIEDLSPLWTMPVNGGVPRRVGSAQCHSARWSPDYRRIACARGATVSILNSDGSASRALATLHSPPSNLAWTPDGERLRFVLEDPASRTDSPWEVRIGKDGAISTPSKLSLEENCCTAWTWLQKDRYFAYARPDGDSKSFLMVKKPFPGSFPGWFSTSPEELPVKIGKVVELVSGRADNRIYLLISNAQRGELLKFDPNQNAFQTFLTGVSAMYVSFSRDGRWISYMNTLDNSLWRSRSDGSERVQLVAPPMQVQLSAWSPDGHEIAFMGKQPGKLWRIFLVDRDGGALREGASGNDDQGAPTWSPDGKRLLYANVHCQSVPCKVNFLDLTTGRIEMVPGSLGFRTARWSPDGKHIAALQAETHEVMLFDVATRRWVRLAGSVNGDDINWTHDSRYVFVDSPQGETPVIERIQIADGRRTTVVSLASLQKMSGVMNTWFGLTPDNSPILLHMFTASEVYALDWAK
jgi:Tol biopolymer transport system component